MSSSNKQGFSLIELSIVILILGLLVVTVVVGRDLVRAGELRGIITQLNTFETGVRTFELKYSGIPGDIANASNRGLGSNDGDGDGLIKPTAAGETTSEVVYFWEHLGEADIVPGDYDGSSQAVLGTTFPRVNGDEMGYMVYSSGTSNYYHIGAVSNAAASDVMLYNDSFVPEDAFAIDEKIDDGLPLKGSIVARLSDCTGGTANAFSCIDQAIALNDGASTTDGTTCVAVIGSAIDVDADQYDFDTTTESCTLRVDFN